MNLLGNYKKISDPIHGHIIITKLASLIIDSPFFQRLRYLHQLGTCYYIFPSSTHTRFEHSIGTYFLTGKTLESILSNSDGSLLNVYLLQIEELKDYELYYLHDLSYLRINVYRFGMKI